MHLPSVYFILLGLISITISTLVTVVMINNQHGVKIQPNKRIELAIAFSIGLSFGLGLGALLGVYLENTPTYLTIGGCVGLLFGILSTRS